MIDISHLVKSAHLAAAAFSLYLCFRLALPFLAPLTWAVALAIVLRPLQGWIGRSHADSGMTSLVLVLGSAVVIGVGAAIIGQQVLREASSGANHMRDLLDQWNPDSLELALPGATALLSWLFDRLVPVEIFDRLGEWLGGRSTILVIGSINQLAVFALTFYFLFYLLRDGDRLLAPIRTAVPGWQKQVDLTCTAIADAVRATLRGTFLVAIIQGFLGGVMFSLLGLPAPAFWGFVMGILAIVPVLGAFVVWIPAALLLALDGEWISAIVLGAWGGIVIAGIDNLLYPVLLGTQLRLHSLIVFIGAVGGIVLFGAPGMILGPVIIAATQSIVSSLIDFDQSVRVRDPRDIDRAETPELRD